MAPGDRCCAIHNDPFYGLLTDTPPGALHTLRSPGRERSRSRSLARAPSRLQIRAILENSNEELQELPGDGGVEDVFQKPEDWSDELQSRCQRAMLLLVHHLLPINFDFMNERNCSRSLRHLISIHDVERFYIGATVDPVRRWFGCAWTNRGDQPMLGHDNDGWEVMVILSLTNDGREFERRLILEGQRYWPELSANRAPDVRGQSVGPNFIYVCLR